MRGRRKRGRKLLTRKGNRYGAGDKENDEEGDGAFTGEGGAAAEGCRVRDSQKRN